MADREQTWTILANFSQLTRQARNAAKAVRDLDDARNKAARNNKDSIVTDAEFDRIDKLSAALKAVTEARRNDLRAAQGTSKIYDNNARAFDRTASSVGKATTALHNHTAALDHAAGSQQDLGDEIQNTTARLDAQHQALGRNTDSHKKASQAHSSTAKSLGSVGASARRSSRDNDTLTKSLISSANASRNASHNTSVLARAIQDIIPVSRSWAFFMKMIPLTAVTSGINSLLPSVMSLGAGFSGLLGTLGPLASLLGSLPAMFTSIGGAAGGLFAGLSGITKAVGAWGKMTEAQAKAERKSTREVAKNAKTVEDATRSREKALRTHQRAVRNNGRAQEKARRDQIRAARDVQEAEARIGEVAEENARRTIQAQQNVAESQKAVAAAQRGVTEARRDAERALKDYQNRLRGATHDEESASISLTEARAALARVLADPGSTALEKKSAQLSVRQAELRLKETRETNADLEKEAAEAQAKGIQGSDQVVSAVEAETQAKQDLTNAQRDLVDTQKENAKATEQAYRSLEDSQQAYADSGERIVELQEDLVDINETLEDSLSAAADKIAEAGNSADGAAEQVDLFNEAMEKLSPAGRDVVNTIIALSEEWDKLKKRSEAAMSPGLLSFLEDLRYKLLPPIGDFLVAMAAGAGDFAKNFGNLLSNDKSLGQLNLILEDAYDFMGLLGEATINVTEWLLGLGAAARKSGLTVYIGEVIRGWTDGWKRAVDTPQALERTTETLRTAQEYATLWGQAIRGIWQGFGAIFRGFQPVGKFMLEGIRDTTQAWREWAESPAGEDKFYLWNRLSKVNLSGLADSIGLIGKMIDRSLTQPKMQQGIENFWKALNGDANSGTKGFIEAMGELLGTVTPEALVSLIDMGTAIADVLRILGESGGRAAVEALLETFTGLAEVFATALKTLPGLSTALLGLMTLMASKKMLVALGGLTGITPMVRAVGDARNKGYAKGDGLAKAAMKEYAGYGNFNYDRTTEYGAMMYDGKRGRRAHRRTVRGLKSNYRPSGAYDVTSKVPIVLPPPQYAASATQEYGRGGTRDLTQRSQIRVQATPGVLGGSHVSQRPAGYSAPAPTVLSPVSDINKANDALKVQAGLVGGVKKAAGGLKSIAGGILRFLGPIGVAFAAWQGLSAVAQHFSSAVPEIEKTQEALTNLVETGKGMEQVNNLFRDAKDPTQGITSAVHDLDSALQFTRDLDTSGVMRFEQGVENLLGPMLGVESRSKKVEQAFEQMDTVLSQMNYQDSVEAFQKLSEGSDLATMSADEMAEHFPQAMDNVRQALVAASNEHQTFATDNQTVARLMRGEVVDGLKVYEGELLSVEEANRRARPTVQELNDEIEEQRRRTKDAADAHRDGVDAIRELNRANREAIDTRLRAQASEDRYLESIQSINAALEENGTDLTSATEKGRANRQMLRDLAQAARDNTDAMYDNGESVATVNARMAEMRDEVIAKLQQDFNLTAIEAGKLADEMGLIPNYVASQILLEVDGSTELAEVLENQIKLINNTDVQHELRIIANTEGFEAAQEAIDAILGKQSQDLVGRTIFTGTTGVTAKATGGPVSGPGTSTSDSIPALLSDGEYVIRTRSARQLGYGTLDHLNRTGRLPGYATGGRVKRYATGGKASGGNMSTIATMTLQFGDLADSVTPAIREIEKLKSLGTMLQAPINTVLDMIGSVIGVIQDLGKVASQTMGNPWTLTWTKARATAFSQISTMVNSMVPMTSAMASAWTKFMDTMKQPIRVGIAFVNDTLGTMVNKVAGFYGVKETPFPVKIDGFDSGGWTGPGSRLQPAGIVHADEFVIKKDSRQKIERNTPGALDYMNRTGRFPGYATGGRVRPVRDPESRNYNGHSGIDYASASGTAVKAAASGTILSTPRLARSYGWHIVQGIAGGMRAIYAHLSGFNTTPGSQVQAGQVIGYTGNTGNSRGPHLHFEIVPQTPGLDSNRAFTRAWLGGAEHGIPGIGRLGTDPTSMDPAAAAAMSALANMVSGPSGALAGLTKSMGTSGWGEIVGKSIAQMGTLALDKMNTLSSQVAEVISSASGNFGSGTQRDNAFGIIDVAMKRGLGHRGALLGVMTAMQESSLINLRGGDRDSVGLFQQRPSMGWGTVSQIMNPVYAANKFFDSLVRLKSWRDGPEWEDIQAVQISAFPRAYQKHKGRALAYLNEWAEARGQTFAGGGWTGPGSTNRPAGIVHADEYVIRKNSRRRLERTAPGLLDHLNETGQIPGYATGGKVADPKKYIVPRTLRNFKPYLSYVQAAQDSDSASSLLPKNPETLKHVQFIENMLAFEGYLSRKDADGRWTGADTEAWKKWQARVGEPDTGQVDYDSFGKLMRWYKLPYDFTTPFVKGYTQPSRLDAITGAKVSSNKQMTEYMNYLNILRGWGMMETYNSLKDLGPNGIPEEYRDSANPLTGMEMAKSFAKNMKSARQHEEALKEAARFEKSESAMSNALGEMIDLIAWGVDGPYGLTTLAEELGLSIDTTAALFKKAMGSGSLKNVSSSRTSRLRREVVDFDNLFRFAKGGIVPGVGDTDSVLALLTPGELVVPKDVVASMFSAPSATTPFLDLKTGVGRRADTKHGGTENTNIFNTNIYNPVAEESSMSVQKRVKSVANLGILRGRR